MPRGDSSRAQAQWLVAWEPRATLQSATKGTACWKSTPVTSWAAAGQAAVALLSLLDPCDFYFPCGYKKGPQEQQGQQTLMVGYPTTLAISCSSASYLASTALSPLSSWLSLY